jgi:hypothetical protein
MSRKCQNRLRHISLVVTIVLKPRSTTWANITAIQIKPDRLIGECCNELNLLRTRSVCHVADVLSDPEYQVKHAARLSGTRGKPAPLPLG